MANIRDNASYIEGTKIMYSVDVPPMAPIKDTAKIFGLPEHLVRQKVLNGEIVAIQAGRRYLVNLAKLAEYLNTHTISASTGQVTGDIKPVPVNL